MTSEQILASLSDQVAVVRLNRPEAKNAISTEMWRSLPAVLAAQQRAGARAVIIMGEGDAFASGADLEEISAIRTSEHATAFWVAIEECLNEIESFPLPTIAMVNGACVGGGCLLAAACDLRFAAQRAFFGVPVARLGIVIDDACVSRLIDLVGDSAARMLLFTGMNIDSSEALRMGLVNKVFADHELADEVSRLVSQIISNDEHSVTEIKASLMRIRHGQEKSRMQQRGKIVDSYLRSDLQSRLTKIRTKLAKLKGDS